MREITLTRNGQTHAMDVEVSTMHADGLKTGDRVLLRIKGDCCYSGPTPYKEYVVTAIKKSDRFDKKCSDVTFTVATKAKETTAVVPEKINTMPLTDDQAANAIRQQYQVVIKSEAATFKERIRLGLMLLQWERFLGEARGGRGGGAAAGLKGWLEKNCPELGYTAALGYKTMAERAVKMLGGGAVVTAALLGEYAVEDPSGEVVAIDCRVRRKADEFFEKADSRRKLEQMWFEFTNGEDRPKRNTAKKVVHPDDPLSMSDSATVMWAEAMRPFEENRAAFHSAARDLKPDVAARFLAELKMLVGALEKAGGDR